MSMMMMPPGIGAMLAQFGQQNGGNGYGRRRRIDPRGDPEAMFQAWANGQGPPPPGSDPIGLAQNLAGRGMSRGIPGQTFAADALMNLRRMHNAQQQLGGQPGMGYMPSQDLPDRRMGLGVLGGNRQPVRLGDRGRAFRAMASQLPARGMNGTVLGGNRDNLAASTVAQPLVGNGSVRGKRRVFGGKRRIQKAMPYKPRMTTDELRKTYVPTRRYG